MIDPLFQAAIYWFLITMIRSSPSQDTTYRLTILISGIFLFTFSSTVVSGGGRSIIRNKGLMLNSTFPRILLPPPRPTRACSTSARTCSCTP
ncbi:MAG: hypothetical protein R2746_16295 [Acidimicrobiales bacterium]